jgi:peptidyl-prolyl cis-trans isomerase D
MSIITKIRNRAGILVGLIALAIISFLFMDVFAGSNGLFGNRRGNTVGEVNGEAISIDYFSSRLSESEENYKANTRQSDLDEMARGQVNDQTWNDIVKEKLLQEQYDLLGISLGQKEKWDLIQGKNVHPMIAQNFTDPKTGKLQVVDFLKNLDKQTPEVKNQWASFEKYIYKNAEEEMYNDLVARGLYATTLHVKRNVAETNRRANARMVFLDFNSINDSSVKVTDADYEKYYNEHKNEFEVKEPARKIKYVVFGVTPSSEDEQASVSAIQEAAAGFAAAEDDSLYILTKGSEEPFFNTFTPLDKINPMIKDTVSKVALKTVVGPYKDGNVWKVSKVLARSSRTDSVGARHILIPFAGAQNADPSIKRDRDQAKALADSVLGIVKGDTSKFAAMAAQFSTDGSKDRGGDLGKFVEGQMVPTFNDYCFSNPKGSVGLVESPFGWHIIQVTSVGNMVPSVKVGTIAISVVASDKTRDEAYTKADQFQSKNKSLESFEKAIEKDGLVPREMELRINDRTISGFPDTRKGVRDAFEAEKGEILPVIESKDNYIVAVVITVKEKGIPTLEDIKKDMEPFVIRMKKGEILSEKMNKALASNKNNIDGLAMALVTDVKQVNDIVFVNAFLPTIGARELTLVGKIFGSKPSTFLGPIVGESGVYYTKIESFIDGPEQDLKTARESLNGVLQGQAKNRVLETLKEGKVEDNRYKFY